MLFLLAKCEFDGRFHYFFQKQEITKKMTFPQSVKNLRRHHDANQNYVNGKVFMGSLHCMKVLFNRSSPLKLYTKMIRQ